MNRCAGPSPLPPPPAIFARNNPRAAQGSPACSALVARNVLQHVDRQTLDHAIVLRAQPLLDRLDERARIGARDQARPAHITSFSDLLAHPVPRCY
jgi:hypothetical protein